MFFREFSLIFAKIQSGGGFGFRSESGRSVGSRPGPSDSLGASNCDEATSTGIRNECDEKFVLKKSLKKWIEIFQQKNPDFS